MILPFATVGIDTAYPPAFKDMGVAGDVLQIGSGATGIYFAETILAGSPSFPIAIPFAMSFAGGCEIGTAIDRIYDELSGRSLGLDVYDWLHPGVNDMITGAKSRCH